MPKRKHVKKVRMAPRTDANQNVREHIERVRKRDEYIAKKIAEYRAKQLLAQREAATNSTSTVDGLKPVDDPANA
jgi:phage shock protein A